MDGTLTTTRLHLRPWGMDDLEVLHTLCTCDRIRYFLFDDRLISRDEVRSHIQASMDSFEQHHYGLWLVMHQGQAVGFAGLLQADTAPSLLYAIHPDLWGRGYATEAARAVLAYGQEHLALPTIHADVDAPNRASIRVLQKLGFNPVAQPEQSDRPLLYFAWWAER